ncbi:FAD-dependent oxidoreductase [Streptomyces sp. NPDC003247]|uniref:FAD-dependent oxidoreductase n=1 Tax=Streptomyces sp. NPDC003247 TaxID=3364677 RepID=UPI0036A0E5BE
MTDVDVIVVGAGPVGLAVALGLARSGVSTVVLDKAGELNTAPRAMAYLHPVLPGLEALGVLDDLRKLGHEGPGINFIDHATGEHLPQNLDVLVGHFPHPYALQLGQGDVGRTLLEHTSALGVEVRWSTEVTDVVQDDEGVTVTCAGPEGPQSVRGRWAVAADGASSTIREKLLKLPYDGFTWPDRFVSTNIHYDFAAHGLPSANWRIDGELGAIIARIDRTGLWRYTFRESADLPVEGLEERIHKHFERGLFGGDYELVQFAPYRMHQRCADDFRHGRILLAGDAAHITNPVGGLGLTGGLLDAFVLYEALAATVRGLTSDAVLDEYAAKRRTVWTDIVSPTASGLKRLVFDTPVGEARDQALAGLRATADDPDLRRENLLAQCAIATPSVLPAGVTL